MPTIKEYSRTDFSYTQGSPPSLHLTYLACLQRIADAAEKQAASAELMATNHRQLMDDRDYYKRCYGQYVERNQKLRKSNAALRGIIGGLRRQLAAK